VPTFVLITEFVSFLVSMLEIVSDLFSLSVNYLINKLTNHEEKSK
jgi:hypothetical protein